MAEAEKGDRLPAAERKRLKKAAGGSSQAVLRLEMLVHGAFGQIHVT